MSYIEFRSLSQIVTLQKQTLGAGYESNGDVAGLFPLGQMARHLYTCLAQLLDVSCPGKGVIGGAAALPAKADPEGSAPGALS